MSVLYSPTSLEKGLKVLFLEHFTSEASLAPQLCHIENSESDSEKYEWLGQAPSVQEFLDERRPIPLSSGSYTITNKTWESTILVSRADLEDNRTGSVRRRIQQMAAAAAGHQNKLIIDALINGTSDLCYDGAAFFANSHPARGDNGGFDNLLAGSGTTTAQFSADFAAAKAAMLNFLDEGGNPFHGDGVQGLTCVVPPALEKAARETLNSGMISNTSNIQVGAADLVVSPRLSDADDWYLLRTDSVRGLIFQDRLPIEFTALEGQTDTGFNRDQWRYGIRARYNVGYAHAQCAVKTVN